MPRSCSRTRLLLSALEQRTVPTTFTVLNTNDAGSGSLRQAVLNANAAAGADSIDFDATAFATPQTILLTSGQITIADAVTITGPAATLTIDGNNASRIFNVDVPSKSNQAIAISSLSLVNGNATSGSAGGILNNNEALTLSKMSISNCKSVGSGGALAVVASGGSLTIADSQLQNNSATGASANGGAVQLSPSTTFTMTTCSVSGNVAGQAGGAMYVGSTTSNISSCTFSGNICPAAPTNTLANGGALLLVGTSTIRNCTLFANSAYQGGGIWNSGTATIQNCTIVSNSVLSQGGGVYAFSKTPTLDSTIVAGNVVNDLQGKVTANNSLFSTTAGTTITGSNNKLNMDPILAFPGTYGGSTQTCPPAAGSPVIDAGSNPAGLMTDQRGAGFPRVLGAAADIGSCEGAPVTPVAIAKAASITTYGVSMQTVTVTYYDDVGVSVASLGTGDITVTGPNSFSVMPAFVGVDINSDGSPRTATYQFAAPGGFWDSPDNGIYQVNMVAGQVIDIDSPTANFVPPGIIGTLTANVRPTILVTNTNDAGPGSLRQALADANKAAGADVIDATGVSGTILLTSGQILISAETTLFGPGSGKLSVSGGSANFRVFEITSANQISISGITITGGKTINEGGAIYAHGAKLALTDVNIVGNSASMDGGGIRFDYSNPELVLNNCTLANNTTGVDGGAFSFGGVTGNKLTVKNTSVYNNTAAGSGGAIWFIGNMTLPSTFVIQNSTISGNQSNATGFAACAIYLTRMGPAATISIQNSTITANSSTTAGYYGIYNFDFPTDTSVLNLESTIISGNGPIDVYSKTANIKTSIIGGLTGITTYNNLGGNIIGSAQLFPLADNGGGRKTHAPMPGSPAINAGSNPANLTTDQRGGVFARDYGSAADIGAFEVQPTSHIQSVQLNDGSPQRSQATSLIVTFDQTVTLPTNVADAFQLKRQSDNALVALSASVNGNAVTLTFTGGAVDGASLADGRYTLTALASQINGTNFDGNGDGVPGDDYLLIGDPTTNKLFRLYGDVDGNGLVDGVDFGAFRTAFNTNSFAFDFDGLGVVDGLDFGQFRARFGMVI